MMVMAFYAGTLSASTLDDLFKIRDYLRQIKHMGNNDNDWMLFAICYVGVNIID